MPTVASILSELKKKGKESARKIYARHGMAWTEKGEFDRALADLTEAVTIDPSYAFGFGQRGHAHFRKRLITKKGGWEPAIEDFLP